MQRFYFVTLLIICCSCHFKEEQNSGSTINLIEAQGYVIPKDSIKPPRTVKAIIPKPIKAGASTVIPLRSNYGNSGGFSLMKQYTTDDGLAMDAISFGPQSSLCDHNGNLWFGTVGGGVSRYDGKSFTNFTTDDGLVNNIVLCVLEDNKQNLWFGTNEGISRYDGVNFTNYISGNGIDITTVLSMIEDSKGNIWFSTTGRDAFRFNGKSFTHYDTKQGLTTFPILNICEDKVGHIWFGTNGGGVSRFDGSIFYDYTKDQGLPSNIIKTSMKDKKGNLWFGTNRGLSCYDGKTFTNYTTENGLVNNEVWSLMEDKSGDLWVGTIAGVSRYDGKNFTNFTTDNGLPNDIIYSIAQDKSDNIWFGTDGGGICCYNGKSFTNYSTKQGLSGNLVLSIAEDKKGNIWFGTDGEGLSYYNKTSFTNLTFFKEVLGDVIYSIIEDRKENIWFATNNGISCYNGESYINYTVENGLIDPITKILFEDHEGNIWLGANDKGVSKFDGTSFTHYNIKRGLPSNNINFITEDSHHHLWFATANGLSKFDGQTFTNYSTSDGLPSNYIWDIDEDRYGNLWISSASGVVRFDGRSFLTYTTKDGLPDNNILQVLFDDHENIMIGTNFGLAVLPAFALDTTVRVSSKSNITAINQLSNQALLKYKPVFEIYNSTTGYPVKDVNSGHNTLFKDREGIIWIATGSDNTALVRFDYQSLHRNLNPPNVIIKNIKINEEVIDWYYLKSKTKSASIDSSIIANQETMAFGKLLSEKERENALMKFGKIQFDSITKFHPLPTNLVLPYKNNRISFDFNAIEPARPYLIKYQYILEGYDNDWSPLTSKTEISYGNISEGTYTFKLKAQNQFGIWSEPIEYTFKVLPPWYRTWWMYLSYGILIITTIAFIIRWNNRKLILRANELKQKVQEATTEIFHQKHVVEEKQKEILDSIHYAQRIQSAILAKEEDIKQVFPESFLLYLPKDIIAGDFYFFEIFEGHVFYAAADCTGHGVPGAIVSVVCSNALTRCIKEFKLTDPGSILDKARELVVDTFKKSGQDVKDGMDISLLVKNTKTTIYKWAGANNPLWYKQNGQMLEIKANKQAIGLVDDPQAFTSHELTINKGDVLYLFTDGYPDQFGGPQGKKFKHKQLNNLLFEISNQPLSQQTQILNTTFKEWKGMLDQVDDVCIIGIRIS